MADIVPVDHGMKKIELAGRGNFPGVTELIRELPIFDLELLERFELADIEISGQRRAAWSCSQSRRTFRANSTRRPRGPYRTRSR